MGESKNTVDMTSKGKFPRTRRDAFTEVDALERNNGDTSQANISSTQEPHMDRESEQRTYAVGHQNYKYVDIPGTTTADRRTVLAGSQSSPCDDIADGSSSAFYSKVIDPKCLSSNDAKNQTVKKACTYGNLHLFFSLFSISTFLFDVGTDIWMAVVYANTGQWWWFGLTLFFVVAASVISTVFSLAWYIKDHHNHKKQSRSSNDKKQSQSSNDKKQSRSSNDEKQSLSSNDKKQSRSSIDNKQSRSSNDKKQSQSSNDEKQSRSSNDEKQSRSSNDENQSQSGTSTVRWIIRCAFAFILMTPVLRYIDVIVHGLRSRSEGKKKEQYDEMLYEEADAGMLRVFECSIESGPQLILQLYIMMRVDSPKDIFSKLLQIATVCTSMLSMSWTIANYHRVLRLSLPDKPDIPKRIMVLPFASWLFVIDARVLAFSVFASQFQVWVFVMAGIHWVAMVTWIQLQRVQFCHGDPAWQEICFSMVAAVIHIFCFFNLKEGQTCHRYLVYYTIVYIENFVMVMLWYVTTQTQEFWYHIPCLVAVLGGFFIGIAIQILYYLKYHPNSQKIKVWVLFSNLQCVGSSINVHP